MGEALYRKYRSKTFDEVVGQEHIIQTLKNALKSKRINHAYLFTGPRGVGKTSVARILAHAVNELDYDKDSAVHLDIIEIDAASNRRIDEIRDIKERVHISPVSGKYKVYIIDEVHMLTREAFNALLKTLEEPPAHCIFILATTEAHKLPETIVSRTQRFSFKPVSISNLAAHLKSIAALEKIDIDDEALELLAHHGEGSFRDSIGALDQLQGSGQKITGEMVRNMLGLPPKESVIVLLEYINGGKSRELLQLLDELWNQGVNPALLAKSLSTEVREVLLSGRANTWASPLLKNLINVPAAPSPRDLLEISLLEASSQNSTLGQETETKIAKVKPPRSSKPKTSRPNDEIPDKTVQYKNENETGSVNFKLSGWDAVLDNVRREKPSLYSVLRLAKPEQTDGVLFLAFEFVLHQKKAAQPANMDLVHRSIKQSGAKVNKIECVVDKTQFTKDPVREDAPLVQSASYDSPHIDSISNIFGAVEMLES